MECTANQQGQSTAPGSCLCSDAEMNPFCKALSEHTRCRLCQASRQLLIKCGSDCCCGGMFFGAAHCKNRRDCLGPVDGKRKNTRMLSRV